MDDNEKLDEFRDVVLVSPGGSPFNTTQIEEIMKQDRVTLLSNRSDIISQMYTANVSNNSQAYYGPHTIHPTYAHNYKQFGTDFDETQDWVDNDPLVSNEEVKVGALAYAGLTPAEPAGLD